MRKTHFGTVRAAQRAIELVIDDNEFDKNPVPYFEPTNLSELSDFMKEKENQSKTSNDQNNRIRAASHLCLLTAAAALKVALYLGSIPIDAAAHEKRLHASKSASQINEFLEIATQAMEILQGYMQPPSGGAITVSKA